MDCQKVINLLDKTPDQPSKFRTKNWVETNNKSWKTYDVNSEVKFKTTLLQSNLYDYRDAYIFVKGIITVAGAGATESAHQADKNNKQVIFKYCSPFVKCITV